MDTKEIKIHPQKKNLFFLIHGYTGSPTDFADLPERLSTNLKAGVYCPLLPGHGTKIEDLDRFSAKDYVDFIEKKLKERTSY